MLTKNKLSESTNGKPIFADTGFTLIHTVTDTNYWHEIYLWVSNPNTFSVDCELHFGVRNSFASESRMIIPPKSGWNLFVPGFILKKSTGGSAVDQTIFMNARDYGSVYVAGFYNKIEAQTYTSTTLGKYALSGSKQIADELPVGALIELRENNYFDPLQAKLTIHEAPSGTITYDEVWIWATMNQAWGGFTANYGYREVFLEWGDTGSVTSIKIPPDTGFVPLVSGSILRNGATIRAWAEDFADSELFLGGFVNRVLA